MIELSLDGRIEVVINKLSGNKNQGPATFILNLIVNAIKDELPKEVFEELNAKYSKTMFEQISERDLKTSIAEEKEAKKLKMDDERLSVYVKSNLIPMYKQCEVIERDLLREIRRLDEGFEKQNGYPEFGILRLTKITAKDSTFCSTPEIKEEYTQMLNVKVAEKEVLMQRLEFVRNLMIGKVNVDSKTIKKAYENLKK